MTKSSRYLLKLRLTIGVVVITTLIIIGTLLENSILVAIVSIFAILAGAYVTDRVFTRKDRHIEFLVSMGKVNDAIGDAESVQEMLFNVLSSNREHQAVIDYIRETDPDMILLLEMTSEWQHDLGVLVADWPYHRGEPRDDNFGIGFYSRIEPESLEIAYLSYQGLPSIGAVIGLGDSHLTFLGAHPVPPLGDQWSKLQNDQLRSIAAYMNARGGPKLLAGDLNNTPWASGFKRLLKETKLRNASRGRGIHASFPSQLGRFGMPIDHILHSSEVIIHKKTIGPVLGSDHQAVVIDFSLAQ